MRIKNDKNLKYSKACKMEGPLEEEDVKNPEFCIIESFERVDDTLYLNFKNESRSIIEARNPKGGRELDFIEKQLNGFIGRSYEELLNADFTIPEKGKTPV